MLGVERVDLRTARLQDHKKKTRNPDLTHTWHLHQEQKVALVVVVVAAVLLVVMGSASLQPLPRKQSLPHTVHFQRTRQRLAASGAEHRSGLACTPFFRSCTGTVPLASFRALPGVRSTSAARGLPCCSVVLRGLEVSKGLLSLPVWFWFKAVCTRLRQHPVAHFFLSIPFAAWAIAYSAARGYLRKG